MSLVYSWRSTSSGLMSAILIMPFEAETEQWEITRLWRMIEEKKKWPPCSLTRGQRPQRLHWKFQLIETWNILFLHCQIVRESQSWVFSHFNQTRPTSPTAWDSCQTRLQTKAGGPHKSCGGIFSQCSSDQKWRSGAGGTRCLFTPEKNRLLVKLKADGLRWDKIVKHFSNRIKGALQVHYCTKLKECS